MTLDLAPEFHPDLRWLQVARPPTLGGALRGHVVAILFWRMGCGHSRNALFDLAALQERHEDRPFAVIGIHVPATPAERDLERLRAFLQRHGLPLAVAHDEARHCWTACGATGWPFLLLVDARGIRRFAGRGEPNVAALAGAVQGLLAEDPGLGLRAPLPFCAVPEPPPRAPSGLAFPTALCRGPDGNVWLADAGHHRLLVVDPSTFAVVRTIGDGLPGLSDGEAPRFRAPTGLAAHDGSVLVSDAGNSALRRVLPDGTVRTLCGTGERSTDRYGGGYGTAQGLNRPAGLAADGVVRLAMAGAHQLWTFDPESSVCLAWLGTGQGACTDGGETATFQQPEGLCRDGDTLWVADAGNGALRAVDLGLEQVRTVARGLGWPTAVVRWQDALLVADAEGGRVWSVPVSGGTPVALLDRSHGLVAPEGLLVLGDDLLVADAGAHRLLVMDLTARASAATLREILLRDVPGPAEPGLRAVVTMARVSLCHFTDVTLWLRPPPAFQRRWPNGTRLLLRACNDDGLVLTADLEREVEVQAGMVRIDTVPIAEAGEGVLRLDLRGPLHPDGEMGSMRLCCVVPVRTAGDGALEARIEVARSG